MHFEHYKLNVKSKRNETQLMFEPNSIFSFKLKRNPQVSLAKVRKSQSFRFTSKLLMKNSELQISELFLETFHQKQNQQDEFTAKTHQNLRA